MNPNSTDYLTDKGRNSPTPSSAPSTTGSTEVPTSSLPSAYVADKAPEDSSKLRTLLSILRKWVKLHLHPTPKLSNFDPHQIHRCCRYCVGQVFITGSTSWTNSKPWYCHSAWYSGRSADNELEYWNYLDRPESFIRLVPCWPHHWFPTLTIDQHWRLGRWARPNARGASFLVYKGSRR